MIRSGALALALVLLTGVAQAQPADVAKADTLFKEGRALMKSGNFETACPKLEESYRLDPAAGTGINLGDCFEKQGKVASALLAYQAARALLKPGDPRIGPVEKEIAALNKRTPRLTIKLAPGAPEGTTVTRDGREVEASKLGVPVAVNPGKFKVVVSAPGRDASVFRVSLVEGKNRELEVGPGEDSGQPASSSAAGARDEARETETPGRVPPDEAAPGSSQQTWGYVLAGVGIVGIALGGYFWAKFESGKSDLKTASDADFRRDKPGVDKDGHWAAYLGVGGAVVLGGGVVLFMTAPDGAAGGGSGWRGVPMANTTFRLRGVW